MGWSPRGAKHALLVELNRNHHCGCKCMATQKQTVAAESIRFVIPGLFLLFLWVRFPGDRVATTVIGVAFLFEQLIEDPLLRLLPWSILGSIAAFYSMQLAFYLDRIFSATPVSTTLDVAFVVVRSVGNLGSLIFLIGRLPIGSRAFAFITFLSIASGSLAYYGRSRSTEWWQDLYYVYSCPSIGCSIGTILGVTLLIFWKTFRESPIE